jgi:hypothetical protein
MGRDHSVFTVYQNHKSNQICFFAFFFEECSGFGGQSHRGQPLYSRVRFPVAKKSCACCTFAPSHPPLPFIKDHPPSQLPSRPILAPLRAATSFCGAALLELGNLFIPACARPDEANRGRVGCFNYSPSPHIITPFDSAILENRKAAEDTP